MKITSSVLLSLCLALVVRAQAQTPYEALSPSPSSPTAIQRTPDVLDTLLGPIALYPDALVALILPASTSPTDVVLAARFLAAKNDQSTLNAQPWSDSVKALVHYPDVLKWMDENLPWTQSLGQAFLDQPADVMNTVQRLRVRARASGALVDTPQQQVVTQGTTVVIVPAQPNVIYVPVYDPAVVYVQRTTWVNRPFITFGFGYPIGSSFIYDCDWSRRTVWVVSRPSNWKNQPQYWQHDATHPEKLPGQPWHPPTNYRPTPSTQVLPHTPTPRPVRLDPKNPPANSTQPAPVSPRPQTGSPGMMSSTPNRSSHIPSSPRKDPVTPAEIVSGARLPTATAAPLQVAPRPVLVKPQAPLTRPTRPFNAEPPDRSHQNIMPTPSSAPSTTNEDSTKPDPRKRSLSQ
jgi:hypothetical protein